VGLYNKFGFWPGHLTALMKYTPQTGATNPATGTVMMSSLSKGQREEAIKSCARLTGQIDKGLDLGEEMRAVMSQSIGEVVLTYTRKALDGFAVCMSGPGTEGGAMSCYVKFGAARSGEGAGARFDRLLDAIDGFAAPRGLEVETGVSLARRDAFVRMRAHGFRAVTQGVAMHRPHGEWYNRNDVYAMDDWR
jgi:hypothetical protein